MSKKFWCNPNKITLDNDLYSSIREKNNENRRRNLNRLSILFLEVHQTPILILMS